MSWSTTSRQSSHKRWAHPPKAPRTTRTTSKAKAMVEGIGVDIIEIERVAEAVARRRFRERIFSPDERAYCEDGGSPRRIAERYAGRFAAKEAVVKALG